jgi:hypothetical protein
MELIRDEGPSETDLMNWNEANDHHEENPEPCTPERVDGELVGCGACSDCLEQEADERNAAEEYGYDQ